MKAASRGTRGQRLWIGLGAGAALLLVGALVGSRAGAASSAGPSPTPPSAVSEASPPPIPTGIIDLGPSSAGPVSPTILTMTDRWQQLDSKGDLLQAIAGADAQNGNQGEVVVQTLETTNWNVVGSQQIYPTPTKDGAVAITAVDGSSLTVVAKDGTTWTFDVASGSYTDGSRGDA